MKAYAANPEIARAMRSLQTAIRQAEVDSSRPIYHLRPPAYWMGDVNGTIYHNGYYHVFYQHNPCSDKWGRTYWGHARSKDITHWEQLPIALWSSREMGEEHCFSGCTVINDRGQPMIFYTSLALEERSREPEIWAAVGDNELITWKKWKANPVLTNRTYGGMRFHEWRDPFVFKEQGRTFMVLGGKLDQVEGGQAVVVLYEAENKELTNWIYRGILFRHPDKKLRSVECPNFFKVSDKWVLLISAHGLVEYFIGTFDQEAFAFRSQYQGVVDHSTDFYATNILFDDGGRCVLWGWIRGFKKNRGWSGCFSLPRILSVSPENRLLQEPAVELRKLRGKYHDASGIRLTNDTYVIKDIGATIEILAEFEPGNAKNFGIRLCYCDDHADVRIVCNGHLLRVGSICVPFSPPEGERVVRLHVFVDKSVLEIYANSSECLTSAIDSSANDLKIELFSKGGNVGLRTLDIWQMKSIWL